jgi:hypothetical protein
VNIYILRKIKEEKEEKMMWVVQVLEKNVM